MNKSSRLCCSQLTKRKLLFIFSITRYLWGIAAVSIPYYDLVFFLFHEKNEGAFYYNFYVNNMFDSELDKWKPLKNTHETQLPFDVQKIYTKSRK